MPEFSVLILTLNEERDLPACLESVRGCDDIVVLDSGSTDRTHEIAKAAGARVVVRPFDTFASQRNYADDHIQFRHPWVFHLDADEAFTPALRADCEASAGEATLDGFFVAPRMLWGGQWIPHCTDFPAWQARFVRVPGFRFIDVGHGQREASTMKMGRLRSNYLHHLSSGGDEEWLAKHRRYARAEANEFIANSANTRVRHLFSGERLQRRRALKRISYSLPCRPLMRFVYQYVLRGGILDGRAGLHYCRLLARYEGFAAREVRALKRQSA